MMAHDPHHDRLELATKTRLAKLGSVPVDTSRAKARLMAIGVESRDAGKPSVSKRFWRAWAATAAVLAVAAGLFFVLQGTGSAAYASSAEMFQLHADLVEGRVPVIPVANSAEAKKAIEAGWPDAPALPSLPTDNLGLHACCLKDVQNRQVACFLLRQDGVPITVVMAKAEGLRSGEGRPVVRGGHEYMVNSREGVNMVMTRHEDRWLCFMGKVPQEELIRLAETTLDHSTDISKPNR